MRPLEAVSTVARLAGAHALSLFRKPIYVEEKADGSPVTEADRGAERVAREWISQHFPEDGILGEELETVNPHASRRWILDPIDGTKAFVRGVPLWGTLVALTEGEEVLAGAIFLPALDELVVAEKGAGCFWNGQRCRVSEVDSLAGATALATDAARVLPPVRSVLDAAQVSRTWGDCYGYVLVATGRAEVMMDPVLSPWDSAALFPIIEEAGGVFTDFAGRKQAMGGSAIATNARLDLAVRERLKPALSQEHPLDLSTVDFAKGNGLVPVVTQDAVSGSVLMVAYADQQALELTQNTGLMHYRSRSRGLWKKGETSGNVQQVESLTLDCDRDTVLARVRSAGPACHTGAPTCFGKQRSDVLQALDQTIADRQARPEAGSYTQKLLADPNKRVKKLGEELAELVSALVKNDRTQSAEELADLLYHALVAVRAAGGSWAEVREVLARRVGAPRRE